MHLDSLAIRRFRSCAEVSIPFHPDLTVLVGENNGGKSNIIDAVRLLTLPLNGRRERYSDDDDLRRGADPRSFEIQANFSGMSDTVKGMLISAVPDPTRDRAVIGLRHELSSDGRRRGRTTMWAGRFPNTEPERGALELIRHAFLPPLRDARYALGSGSATRIEGLLKHFLAEGEEEEFLNHVRRADAPHRVIQAVNTEIGTALGNVTSGVRPQSATLDFATEAITEIARALRFRLSDAGLPAEDISLSGLGYANLLYMAAVVVELAKAREADLTLFLVEEPEAHLHPQLQMLVLDFLLDHAKQSAAATVEAGQPEGRIQIIVTTHSPNLTAWVSPEHLVVVRSATENGNGRVTKSVPLARLGLSTNSIKKISRYLDVTRSALLFGNRALLVEGIAEALLFPVFASHVVLRNDPDARRRFRGAVLVPIDGVDFSPYVEVLLKPREGVTVSDLVVLVTDADPTVPGNRQGDLEALTQGWGTAERLRIFTNTLTLEYELYVAGNEGLLRNVFLSLHPRSENEWRELVESRAPAEAGRGLLDLLKRKRTRKGDFAQGIAQHIVGGTEIVVPTYIQNAIRAIAQQ